MSDVIPFDPTRPPRIRQITLDQAWSEAETLGEVSVQHCNYGGKYRATIMCRLKQGLAFPEGKHDSPVVALGIAIHNARELGAGLET